MATRIENLCINDMFDLDGCTYVVRSVTENHKKQCQPLFAGLVLRPLEIDCDVEVIPYVRGDAVAELAEALDTLVCIVGLTAFKHEGQRAVLQEAVDLAIAALTKHCPEYRERVERRRKAIDENRDEWRHRN